MLILLAAILASLSLIYLLGILLKSASVSSELAWVPGPPALPILGNYFDLVAVPPEESFINMYKFYKKYGAIFKVWNGSTPIVYCQDVETLKDIFKDDEKTCRPAMYRMVREYLGPGLLFGEADEKWKVSRKYILESFHKELLVNNIDLTLKKVKSLFSILDQRLGGAQNSQHLDLIPLLKACFLDVSVGAIVGVESNALEEPSSCPYLDAVERMGEVVMARLFSPLLSNSLLFKLSPLKKINDQVIQTIKRYTKNIVKRRQAIIQANQLESGKKKIIVDTILTLKPESKEFLQNVEDQASNNIFASYDTLATLSSLLLFAIGNDSKLQDEILEEINAEAPNLLEDGVDLAQLSNLRLLDRCAKEALRMFPPAPMIGRRLTHPLRTKDGVLPAGAEVYINMFCHHRDAAVYPDPDRFRPDRFLPEEAAGRHALSWIPFGFGSRSCVGQKTAMIQSKMAVAMILKKYSIKSYEKLEDLKLIANVVMRSRDGVRVNLTPRGNQ